jgi:hypothetical protein
MKFHAHYLRPVYYYTFCDFQQMSCSEPVFILPITLSGKEKILLKKLKCEILRDVDPLVKILTLVKPCVGRRVERRQLKRDGKNKYHSFR